MISTLAKFPWFSVDNYTITTRDQLFAATRDQLRALTSTVNRGGLPGLTENLLNDLLIAGLNAHGFSERQRWELRQAAGFVGARIAMSPLAQRWPFEALGRKAGVEEDVVEVSSVIYTLPLASACFTLFLHTTYSILVLLEPDADAANPRSSTPIFCLITHLRFHQSHVSASSPFLRSPKATRLCMKLVQQNGS